MRNGEFLVSVKTRIGKNEVEEWPELMQVYNRYPIHELTVHPRIQKEFYKGTPHLDVFADILKESRNPVVYNGDLFTVEKVKEFREKLEEYPPGYHDRAWTDPESGVGGDDLAGRDGNLYGSS